MNIKLSGIIFFLSIIAFPCCNKNSTTTVYVSDHSTLGLLTGKQWELDSVYNNYTVPGTGTLIYARGVLRTSPLDDSLRIIYWPDGNIDAFDGFENYFASNYVFIDSDSTTIKETAGGAACCLTDYIRILKLDATHFTYYDSSNNALDISIYKP
ncbi:MAG TPA: hypothetical protein VKR53_05680 [Puia sp.]|nr:hypothetical protein [Puia sp.]